MWSGQKARLIALDARRGRNHDRPGNCCGGRAASLDTLRWLRRRWAGGWLPLGASLDYVGAGPEVRRGSQGKVARMSHRGFFERAAL
jgi:hypothetical protein